MQNLKHGIERGANSAAGWKALAELQYQNRQFQDAYDTAVNGLEWSVKRRRAGHEQLTSFALALRLVVAQCLRRLQRLDEAEYNFQVLAGKCISQLQTGPGEAGLMSLPCPSYTPCPCRCSMIPDATWTHVLANVVQCKVLCSTSGTTIT